MVVSAIANPLALFYYYGALLLAAKLIMRELFPLRSAFLSSAERALCVVCAALTLSGLLATAFVFLHWNDRSAYLVAITLLCALLLARSKYQRAHATDPRPAADVGETSETERLLAVLLPVAIGAYTLAIAISPDNDSLSSFSILYRWVTANETPYSLMLYDAGFPAFWELSYVPAILVSSSFHYAWTASLFAPAILGLAVFTLSRRLGMAPQVALAVAFSEILLWHFISGSAVGISSNKPDSIVAAGFVMLALAGVIRLQSSERRLPILLALFGSTFVCTKYSGPLFLLAFVVAVLAIRPRVLTRLPRALPSLIWPLLVFTGAVGHYYLHNFLHFGTPFWPARASLIPLSFAQHHVPDFLREAGLFSEIGQKALLHPGSAPATATATSYFAHANDPQLWHIFGYFSVYGGFWFAGTLAFGFGLPLIYLAMRTGSPRLRTLARSPCTSFLFLFAWLGILLFLVMPNGAGVPADNYSSVHNLGNVRYGLGPIVLTEVLAFFVLSGVLPPLSGPLLLAGVACGARVQHFVTNAYFGRDLPIFLAATLVYTAICWAIHLASRSGQAKWPRRARAAIIVPAILLALYAGPEVSYHAQKEAWKSWSPAFDWFDSLPGKRIGLAYDPRALAPFVWADPAPLFPILAGRWMQHSVRLVDVSLSEPAQAFKDLDYVVWLRNFYLPPEATQREEFLGRIRKASWHASWSSDWVIIAEPSSGAAVQ